MSKSDSLEHDVLALLFNGTIISGLADNAITDPITDFWLSLHTADPGEGDDQSAHEATYSGYVRKLAPRTSAFWTVTGNTVHPAALIAWQECTGVVETLTHWAIGTSAAGGRILYSGTVTPPIVTGVGVTPQLTAATVITED